MSETERAEVEGVSVVQAKFPTKIRTFSIEKVPKTSDSQTITINLYSNPLPKFDKPVQTDTSTSTITVIAGDLETKAEPSTKSENKENDSFDEFPVTSFKKSSHSISDELEEEKSMDIRRQVSDSIKNVMNTRGTSDLERRKLEAELKAAEEIAKIKQTVIEKRLALELASLEDGVEYQKMQTFQPTPQPDLLMLEEMARRKQSMIENSLANELENLEYVRRPQPSRSVPPPVPSRHHSAERAKSPGVSNDIDYMSGNPKNIRNIHQADTRRRNTLDLRSPPLTDPRVPLSQIPSGSADVRYAPPTEVRYMNQLDDRNFLRQGYYYYGPPERTNMSRPSGSLSSFLNNEFFRRCFRKFY